MSNFFAALDSDSDDDVKQTQSGGNKAVQSKKQVKKKAPKPAPEPAKPAPTQDSRDSRRGGRNENKKRTGRGGKREYDRRSGTGRGREIKKGGAGGHNWGREGEETVPTDAAVEKDVEENPVEEDTEPAVVEKTLEEYFAERAALRQGDAFEDLGDVAVEEVKEGKQYSKKDKEAMEVDDAFVKTTYSKQRRQRGRKEGPQMVESGFYVKDKNSDYESRPYRGRSSRGRGRGRGRGGFRGGRGGASAGFVDSGNMAAFPALGATN